MANPWPGAERMTLPVLLDMDPGVDDALAILLAAVSPELDIRAITVCAGNVGLARCGLNALTTLQRVGLDNAIPVALGASRPLRRRPCLQGESVHGPDGLGGVCHLYPGHDPAGLDPRPAVDVILQAARDGGDRREAAADTSPRSPMQAPLTIIATGPLTNIALAISLDPEAMRRVGRIVWMGGAYTTPGNVTPVAEFNAYCDPDAAAEVLSFGIPVLAVGLDVTHQCKLTRQRLLLAADSRPESVLGFARDICQRYMDFHRDSEGQDLAFLHDPLAVGLAARPDLLIRSERHRVEVVCEPGPAQGMTIIDRRPGRSDGSSACEILSHMPSDDLRTLRAAGFLPAAPTVDVALEVQAGEFVKWLLERLGNSVDKGPGRRAV
jgi:inosine-uridine nucleoside N-ribohydrolase